jgi:uncharacterized protein (DUF1697 family)
MAEKYVLLLRGINVTPSTRVAMSDLRELVSEAGYSGVRTLLQSGNVILKSSAAPDISALDRAIASRTGVNSRALVLDAARFRRIVATYPVGDVALDEIDFDESKALITFVDGMPESDVVVRLSDAELAPERLVLGAEAVYQWLPDGILATKLPAKFARQFGENATARNLRTSKKIVALLDA